MTMARGLHLCSAMSLGQSCRERPGRTLLATEKARNSSGCQFFAVPTLIQSTWCLDEQ